MNTAAIVQKLWNYCNVLLDDGMGYGDYVEQLTYLLFLKMADERARAPYNRKSPIPAGNDGPRLLKRRVLAQIFPTSRPFAAGRLQVTALNLNDNFLFGIL